MGASRTGSTPLAISRKAALAAGFSALVALGATVGAVLATPLPGDLAVERGVQALATPWLDTLMRAVSLLNDDLLAIGSTLLVAALLALWRRWPASAAFLGVLALNLALRAPKALVHRPRPLEELVRVLESGQSGGFPSGHAYHAVVFWGLVLALLLPHIRSKPLRWAVALAAVGFILLTGVSRIYLGAHWPSDVLGALAYGIPSLALLYYGYTRIARSFKAR
jgi:undecaprenyl-diphosphatase